MATILIGFLLQLNSDVSHVLYYTTSPWYLKGIQTTYFISLVAGPILAAFLYLVGRVVKFWQDKDKT